MRNLLLAAIPILLLVVVLHSFFPDTLSNRASRIDLIQSVAIAAFLLSSLIVGRRALSGNQMLKSAAIWIVLILGLVLAYSFVPDLKERFAGTLLPSKPIAREDGGVEIRASDDGHFYVDAMVNGVSVRFLVDTGASDVVLTREAAARAGLHPAEKDFVKPYNTANGTGMGAPVVLNEVSIGSLTVRDVRGSVNNAPMSESLLGISFLNQLGGYEVSADTLILRP